MQIDWITTVAQLVNFLVLLWALRRFLYRPILESVDRRESLIRQKQDQAAAQAGEATAQASALAKERKMLAQEKEALLKAARSDANDLKTELLKEIKFDLEKERTTWQGRLDAERFSFAKDAALRAAEQVLTITRKVLSQMTGCDLDKKALDIFVRELSQIDGKRKIEVAKAISAYGTQIKTAAPLSAGDSARLTKAVRRLGGETAKITFDTDPSLLAGARLTAGSHCLEWSIATYLRTFEGELKSAIDAGTPSEPVEQQAAL